MSAVNSNAFALLDDEGTVDAGMLAAKLPVTKVQSGAKTENATIVGTRNGSQAGRGPRVAAAADRGRSARSNTRETGEQNSFDAESAPSSERARSGKGGGRGRGRGRGGERAGKREFDRHDASGRGHETEKRHGGGRGNWGAEGEEVKEMADKLTLAEGEEIAGGSEGEVAVEEEKNLTLEEYEALLQEKRAGLNVQRDAAFKVDEAQFQGMKTFEKQEEDVGLTLNKNAKTAGVNKGGRDRERKEREVLIDVGFKVQSAEERAPMRGGRSGRGADRRSRGSGSRGRPSGRSSGRGPAINMQDASAFPSLG